MAEMSFIAHLFFYSISNFKLN